MLPGLNNGALADGFDERTPFTMYDCKPSSRVNTLQIMLVSDYLMVCNMMPRVLCSIVKGGWWYQQQRQVVAAF